MDTLDLARAGRPAQRHGWRRGLGAHRTKPARGPWASLVSTSSARVPPFDEHLFGENTPEATGPVGPGITHRNGARRAHRGCCLPPRLQRPTRRLDRQLPVENTLGALLRSAAPPPCCSGAGDLLGVVEDRRPAPHLSVLCSRAHSRLRSVGDPQRQRALSVLERCGHEVMTN